MPGAHDLEDAMMTRDEYVQKLKSQLDEWNAELARWEAKSAEVQAEARAEYEKQLEGFRKQRDQGMEQMRQLQAAAEQIAQVGAFGPRRRTLSALSPTAAASHGDP